LSAWREISNLRENPPPSPKGLKKDTDYNYYVHLDLLVTVIEFDTSEREVYSSR